MSLRRYRPAVAKPWLFITAGAVWLGVGLMLIEFASGWLTLITSPAAYAIAGIALATCIYFFGFSRLARKNIRRIQSINLKRICLFAFQEWRSYPLVLFMIFLGIYLRMYSPIPKPLLAVLYIGIGGGLLSSSLHYFKHALASRLVGAPKHP